METKVSTKKIEADKSLTPKPKVDGDPFAAAVEAAPAKKRVVKKATATATPVKKVVKKAVNKTPAADPFAETVETQLTVAKPVVKKARAKAATAPKAVAKVAKMAVAKVAKKTVGDVTAEIAATEPVVELSPAFKALAEPALPSLDRENRARLLMQTPTKLYFYWSVKENPYHLLRSAFGDETGSYTLVLKFTDLRRDSEQIHAAEAEGNWWFDVEPDGEYQAEIGFYAPSRPYFRIIYSNTINTPRRSPSPRSATGAKWTVTANTFAEVLDIAGFSQDAFDVAMTGDDYAAAENATHIAFARFVGTGEYELNGIAAEDIRYAMMALASGTALESMRGRIGPGLFAILQANTERLDAKTAMGALNEFFDIDEDEFAEEQRGPAVYGASLVNFPRTLKRRALSPKFAPLSSHSIR